MSKEEYLWLLRSNLQGLPPEEINNIIEYYREYFEDAGEENTENVIQELGAPINLADRIKADFTSGNGAQYNGGQFNGRYGNGGYYNNGNNGNGSAYDGQKKKDNTATIILIIAAVVGSVVWVPLLIAVVAVVFSMGIAVVAMAGGFVIAGAGVLLSGIAAIGVGIYTLFIDVPTGVMLLGTGFGATGIGMLLLLLDIWIARWIIKFFVFMCNKIKQAYSSRKERKNNEKVF